MTPPVLYACLRHGSLVWMRRIDAVPTFAASRRRYTPAARTCTSRTHRLGVLARRRPLRSVSVPTLAPSPLAGRSRQRSRTRTARLLGQRRSPAPHRRGRRRQGTRFLCRRCPPVPFFTQRLRRPGNLAAREGPGISQRRGEVEPSTQAPDAEGAPSPVRAVHLACCQPAFTQLAAGTAHGSTLSCEGAARRHRREAAPIILGAQGLTYKKQTDKEEPARSKQKATLGKQKVAASSSLIRSPRPLRQLPPWASLIWRKQGTHRPRSRVAWGQSRAWNGCALGATRR